MKRELLKQTKQGVASLYVVIFATILFGVITLSFVRIMVSESSQTTDSDLSQSAYDAALAGVEDAKLAANRYYTCLNKPGGTADNCGKLFELGQECDGMKKYLNDDPDATGEVAIREDNDGEHGNNANQAYTCVKLSNEVSDFLFTLDASTRVQVVPIAVSDDAMNTSTIRFSWFTEKNGTTLRNLDNQGLFADAGSATVPPAIGLSLITTGQTIDLNELAERDSERFTSIVALPSENVGGLLPWGGEIGVEILKEAATATEENSPVLVECAKPGEKGDYACQVNLDVKDLMQTNGDAYLVASMPYGVVETDCIVEKLDDDGNSVPFKDVQVKVDSTGRAYDLYRRVETRLSPAASSYPFPQFELEITGDGNGGSASDLKKNFWITTNCWGDGCLNNGSA